MSLDSIIVKTPRTPLSLILLRFAWLIEIFAVITGLAISLMVGITTYTKNLQIPGQSEVVSNVSNTIIAALPFVMVSIVELAKIPVAQAVYQTKTYVWKSIFIIALIFLAIITFETALNGFERNFNNLNYSVSQAREELQKNKERTITLDEQISKAEELSRETVIVNFTRQNKVFLNNREKNLSSLRQQESLGESKSNDLQITSLKTQIKGLIENKNTIRSQLESEISSLNENTTEQRNRIDNESRRKRISTESKLNKIRQRLKEAEEQFLREKKNCFLCQEEKSRFDRKSEDLREREAVLEKDLSKISIIGRVSELTLSASQNRMNIRRRSREKLDGISEKIEKFNLDVARLSGIKQSDIEKERGRLNKDRQRIDGEYKRNLAQITQQKQDQLNFVTNRETKIRDYTKERNELAVKVSELKSIINKKAADTQVYRIALMFEPAANTAADVSPRVVNLVGKVWFGSLAMVIAITGILLALASEVLNDEKNTVVGINRGVLNNIFRAVRSGIAALLMYVRNRPKIVTKEIEREVIKEVIKEVPVEKVVFKDVPIEIITKEVVHVPIYTNDMNLLKNKP